MHKIALVAAAIATLAAALPAQAQSAGTVEVRARALSLKSANKDETDLGLNLSVNDKVFPEVDLSYYLTPNLAAELVLTYPQKHDVRAGSAKLGTLKHLPPTLSLQYYFNAAGVRPYVGAGLNYTVFSSVDLPPGITVKKNSTGLSYGAGLDVPLGSNWVFNLDVKKVQIATNIYVGGVDHGKLRVDPTLFSIGVGKLF